MLLMFMGIVVRFVLDSWVLDNLESLERAYVFEIVFSNSKLIDWIDIDGIRYNDAVFMFLTAEFILLETAFAECWILSPCCFIFCRPRWLYQILAVAHIRRKVGVSLPNIKMCKLKINWRNSKSNFFTISLVYSPCHTFAKISFLVL